MEKLTNALIGLKKRLALHMWIRYSALAVLASATLACLLVVLVKLFPAMGPAPVYALSPLVVALGAAAIVALRRMPDLEQAAVLADQALGTDERLISSLQLMDSKGPMYDALRKDALGHIGKLDPKTQFPLRATGPMRWAVAPVIVLGLLYGFLPEFDLFDYREKEAARIERERNINARVEKLKTLAHTLKAPENEKLSEADAVAMEIDRVAEDLESGNIDDKAAIAKLSDLAERLEQMEEDLKTDTKLPGMEDSLSDFSIARDIASDMQQGKMNDAAKKMNELRKKLESGELSESEQKELAKDMKKMAESMKDSDSALGKALSKQFDDMARSLNQGDMKSAMENMDSSEMTMKDLASVMDQMEKMKGAKDNLMEVTKEFMSGCPNCGSKEMKDGKCPNCGFGKDGEGSGLGMKGKGKGKGGMVGKLPDVNGNFKPTILPGPTTKGKNLASIMERATPDEGAETSLEYVNEAFTEVKMEAEEALTKEEIPPGSKEYIRHYFGAIDPNEGEKELK